MNQDINELETNVVYNEDCLIGMERIPDNSIDMILCDLPYGTTRGAHEKLIPYDKLWEQYKRIIKKNGAIVLFAQPPFDKTLACSNLEWFKYEWIWVKEQGTGHLNSKFAPMKKHENILVFSKSAASYVKDASNAMNYFPIMSEGTPYKQYNARVSDNYGKKKVGTRYPTDVLEFQRDKIKVHPTQKPVALAEYLIKTYTKEGDIVLDNCMGSGTTALAAIHTNRRYIGFELNKKFYDICMERINGEFVQNTLF